MTKTLSYLSIYSGGEVNVQDDILKALVNSGVDCFIDEKQRLMVHPDQWDNAQNVLVQGPHRSAILSM